MIPAGTELVIWRW